jgi:hypothetical protein
VRCANKLPSIRREIATRLAKGDVVSGPCFGLFRFYESTSARILRAAELPTCQQLSYLCAAPRPPAAGGICDTVCIYNVRYE